MRIDILEYLPPPSSLPLPVHQAALSHKAQIDCSRGCLAKNFVIFKEGHSFSKNASKHSQTVTISNLKIYVSFEVYNVLNLGNVVYFTIEDTISNHLPSNCLGLVVP
jgi:hypothetical protein